jgi:hypothetical protein
LIPEKKNEYEWEVSKDADLARSGLCRFLSGWNSFIE